MSNSALVDIPLHRLVFGDMDHELASTRRALERVPDEHWDWKPHEKSYSLGVLAAHLSNIVEWGAITIQVDDLDFSQIPTPKPTKNREEVLAEFDLHAEKLKEAMPSLNATNLMATWTMRSGEDIFLQLPRQAAIRGFVLNHLIHHRAQLTVYLRLLDVPVPGLYGPSADEPM